ncbi:copper chaperone PCu(A)C [Paracoccus xiamenensis]|uniref:copper chaperone PCu(A)C n=1 Tax=Paracoccus xiamenensis TaxID=2714901 RepID=UPI001409F30F|nr:copper chaperone PCu(A)C [Paracoccus xiamenensis]NHF73708.1 copper chaperone PCu(A)C [Paracoccus xiamenensis]
MKLTTLAALAAIALPAAAFAQDATVTVADGYARSANPKAGGAFMTIRNGGAADCTLSGVSTDVAEVAELHTHKDMGDGVMKMTKIEGGITIPAGAEHGLVRGGDHVMLMGLKAPLENGQEVALALDFGDCGTVDAVLPVDNDRKPAEAAPMNHGAHAMPASN